MKGKISSGTHRFEWKVATEEDFSGVRRKMVHLTKVSSSKPESIILGDEINHANRDEVERIVHAAIKNWPFK